MKSAFTSFSPAPLQSYCQVAALVYPRCNSFATPFQLFLQATCNATADHTKILDTGAQHGVLGVRGSVWENADKTFKRLTGLLKYYMQ